MFLRISFDIFPGPVQERIDLEQTVVLQLQYFGICPDRGLVAANASDPGFHILQAPLHWLDFVDEAAQVWVFHGQGADPFAGELIPACIPYKLNTFNCQWEASCS